MPGIPLVVALDGITDPRNLGAIVRSVAAFGGHGVVVPERRSAGMTASAWKTSAGAAARMPVARATNLTRALEDYQKAGFFVVGLDVDGDVELPDLELADRAARRRRRLRGQGPVAARARDLRRIVSIPMRSAVESLNAGVAAGVTLYEVARRRRQGPLTDGAARRRRYGPGRPRCGTLRLWEDRRRRRTSAPGGWQPPQTHREGTHV